MNCYFHPDRVAVQRCDKCGQVLCQECSVILEGRTVCRVCVKNALEMEHVHDKRVKYPHSRNSNMLVVFILALCVPGAAHMYMGLMKRGLLVLSSLFLTIWATAELNLPYLSFVIGIICIAAFFDALHTRKRIISGEYVEDGVSDITETLKRFKVPLIILIIYMMFSNVFGSMRYSPVSYVRYNFNSFVPVGIAVLVLYILLTGKKKKVTKDEVIDMRDNRE